MGPGAMNLSMLGQQTAVCARTTFAGACTPELQSRRSERRSMAKRKALSKRTRFEVFKRDSFKCQYCGKAAPDVVLRLDHIHPVSKDGENDLLNLITACVDCNAGKSDVLLSDATAIAKQRDQLEQLNERREQLEMLLQWREALRSIKDDQLSAVEAAWKRMTPGWSLNDNGRAGARKLIGKFGLAAVLAAIETAEQYIRLDAEGKATGESFEHAFSKIGGICRIQSMPEQERQLYFIRGVCRKRFDYCNDWKCIELLREAYALDASIDYLMELARQARSWTQWQGWMQDVIEELKGAKAAG